MHEATKRQSATQHISREMRDSIISEMQALNAGRYCRRLGELNQGDMFDWLLTLGLAEAKRLYPPPEQDAENTYVAQNNHP